MEEIKRLVREELLMIEQIKTQNSLMISTLQELGKDHEGRIRLLENHAVRQTEILTTLKELHTAQAKENKSLEGRILNTERKLYVLVGIAFAFQFLVEFAAPIKALIK